MNNFVKNNKKVELLAPAGNLEKLKYALHYGADAVYCGIPDFSLRVRINQFSPDDLKEAVQYVHKRKKKIYITLNIYAHNRHLEKIKKHLKFLSQLRIDGVIVSDPGIINLVKKYLPKVDIHLSTQANATNYEAVKFWKSLGVRRVILAREVTLAEIKEISQKVKGVELEIFVHGAMCMSYSGRCILSKWMSNRSANLGDCTQPCRWSYKIKDTKEQILNLEVEENLERFGVDLEEDRHGTYFFNSYDLNLISQVENIISAGVTSLKVEGRAKSVYYVAVVVRAYRKVIDAIKKNISQKELERVMAEQKTELEKLTNRGYTTGFLLGGEPDHNYQGKMNKGSREFVGEIIGQEGSLNIIKVHNALLMGNELEAITPQGNLSVRIKKLYDWNKREIQEAHGGHANNYYVELDRLLAEKSLICKL